jgi:DNA damage-inducible protein 1
MIVILAEKFTEVLNRQQAEHSERERDRIRLLTADPFDQDAQKKIAEEIRYQLFLWLTNSFK